jgi:DNA ligase-1
VQQVKRRCDRRIVTGDSKAATVFSHEALARSYEGVMVKALEAPYEAGSRGAGWFKIKEVHTFDLTVIAAEWGSGRRKGLAIQPASRGARSPHPAASLCLAKG